MAKGETWQSSGETQRYVTGPFQEEHAMKVKLDQLSKGIKNAGEHYYFSRNGFKTRRKLDLCALRRRAIPERQISEVIFM